MRCKFHSISHHFSSQLCCQCVCAFFRSWIFISNPRNDASDFPNRKMCAILVFTLAITSITCKHWWKMHSDLIAKLNLNDDFCTNEITKGKKKEKLIFKMNSLPCWSKKFAQIRIFEIGILLGDHFSSLMWKNHKSIHGAFDSLFFLFSRRSVIIPYQKKKEEEVIKQTRQRNYKIKREKEREGERG